VTNCVLVGNSAGGFGGGVYGGVLNRCQLINNSTATGLGSYGGGAFGSTLNSCLLRGNISDIGGGAALSGLNNCTLAGNATSEVNPAFNYGGGADESVLNNCIVYGNAASSGNNYNNSTLNYCCTTPLPGSGTGNFTNAPLFVDLAGGDFHLQSSSLCINAGNNSYVTTTNDLDGNPRIQGLVVDMGAYEFPIPVAVNADYTNVVTNFLVHLSGQVVAGNVSVILLDFGDGTILTNQLSAAHSWAAPGDYAVTLTVFSDLYPGGISALVTVHVAEGNYFVALTNTNPVAPYTSWDTAATNIQDAVDVASVGGTILVSNGVYQTGERTAIEASDGSTNRLVVDRMVLIQSVNGPANTRIDGAGSFRCVYLASGAMFSGFTLTNGMSPGAGGGLLAESNSATVSNCVFIGNAGSSGGGASGGTLNDCVFLNNSASSGGGVASGVYNNCTLIGNGAWNGGGAISATLNHCVLNENHAYYSGGAESSSLNNCALTNNSGENHGGAASESVFNNCTLAGNSAFYGGGGYNVSFTNCQFITNSAGWGGAIYGGSMQSCTLTSNSAAFYGGGAMYATL
jgi:PKD domain